MKRPYLYLLAVLVLSAMNVSAANPPIQEPQFVSGRIIVKYKDSAPDQTTESTIDTQALSTRIKSGTATSIDRLKSKHHVRKQRALFRTNADEQRIRRKHGFVNKAFAKQQYVEDMHALQQKFSKRTKRIS